MDTHLVFYVDLLGVRAALENPNQERIERLTKLLHDMASLRGGFEVDEDLDDLDMDFSMRPEISSFSDHIVISFKKDGLSRGVEESLLTAALYDAQTIVEDLAFAALDLDLLIRGGVSLGPLHHSDGVVIGSAMVEAYRLESEIANYPRVVMASDLCDQIEPDLKPNFVLTDQDGVQHFNYFGLMTTASVEHDRSIASVRPHIVAKVADNIAMLEAGHHGKQLAKWEWFRDTLERERFGYQSLLNRLKEMSD